MTGSPSGLPAWSGFDWPRSWQQGQFAEVRSHNGEVSAIKRGDVSDAESFGCCDHRSVGCAEREIAIARDEFCDPQPVAGHDRLRKQVACREVSEETHLGIDAKACAEEVGDLGDDECGNDERTRVCLEQFQAGGMMSVVAIDVCVEGPCVDDQCDGGTSLARISSMRSEMSSRPLAPAPAASSRRLPRWVPSRFSIASRVSSETVLPRRSAS